MIDTPSNLHAAGQSGLISAVVPVYCEERVIPELYARLKAALESLAGFRHEIVFVNDGSIDSSPRLLGDLARKDPAVRVLSLSRNFGHQLAITAGLDHAAGDVVVVLDADLQDPPEVIADMVRKWQEGFQVVYGVRESREGEPFIRLAAIKVFYRLLSYLSDIKIPLDSGDFRLMDRVVVDALLQLREESRYIRGLVSWVGYRQCPLRYGRQSRHSGHSKYRLARLVRLALDGISSFSERPLRLSSHLGFLVTAGSLLLMLYVIIGKLINPQRIIAGWASVMAAVLFLGGVQLLSIGILGEYVGRIFRQAKNRPLYIVAERINFEHAVTDPARGATVTSPAEGNGN